MIQNTSYQSQINIKEFANVLIPNLPGIFFLLDEEGHPIFSNRCLESMSGYTDEELLQLTILDLFSDYEKPRISDAISKVVTEGKASIEANLLTKNGDQIPCFFNIAKIDVENRPLVVGTGCDISSLKRSEADLLALSQAVEQSPISQVLTDLNGTIKYVNTKFCEVTGYEKEELVGHNQSMLKSGHQGPDFYEELWRTIASGNKWHGELINKKKSGEEFIETVTITPIKGLNNEIIQYLGLKEGMVDKKRTERILNERINHLAESRSAMLNMMEDLEKAKKEAESATEAKTSFLANMSHEIRTPMNSVLGFLALSLEDSNLTEDQYNNLSTAYNSAKALLVLINDILDISKLESGKMELDNDPFCLPKLLLDSLQVLNFAVKEKGLKVILNIHPDIPQNVVGDSARLKQVLLNLVGNAVKFTDKGSITVNVNPWSEKDMVHFSIQDTGIGLQAERIKKIFDPFVQADSSTSRRFGGTGLGTTISRQLVELMNGHIWVESVVNKGSTFHFTSQLTATDLSPIDSILFNGFGGTTLSNHKRCFNVLMAEDMEANRTLAKIRLEQQGHTVQIAKTGLEVVEKLQKEHSDIILMDIQMPVLDGIEATRRIRELETEMGTHIPIIALTASIMKEDIEACKAAGTDMVVGKPIDFAQLFILMEAVVPEGIGQPYKKSIPNEEQPNETLFPQLVGINTEKGLKTWGTVKPYIKSLIKFSYDFESVAGEISEAMHQGDIDVAIQKVHALKGVSGNLAADSIMKIVSKMYTLLKQKRLEAVVELVPSLEKAIKTAVHSIRSLETDPPRTHAVRSEINRTQLKEIFHSMLNGFEQYNPDAVKPYLTGLKNYLTHDQLIPIEKRLNDFNFDAAKQEIERLAMHLNINLDN